MAKRGVALDPVLPTGLSAYAFPTLLVPKTSVGQVVVFARKINQLRSQVRTTRFGLFRYRVGTHGHCLPTQGEGAYIGL